MFSNCAPDSLNGILDEIIAGQAQQAATHKTHQSACVDDLKVLSSWLFQDDALITMNKAGGDSRANILKLVNNPHLSNILLEQMSEYPDPSVRTAVAEHDNLPGQVFFALSQDHSVSVRYAVARNLTTPLKILEQLCEDDNPHVVDRAAITIAAISRQASSSSSSSSSSSTNVVNFNFKENFKAQNTLPKTKKLSSHDMAVNGRSVRNIAF
jgi:hypothetical protein